MDETGIRFPGYLLDPTAQEFRPTNRNPYPPPSSSSPEPHNFTLLHPQIYYPYPPPPPPSPLQVLPFYDGGFHQHSPPPPTPMAYVSPSGVQAPSTSPLPPLTTAETRALLLSSVPKQVTEATVRREMEVYGDVRAVQMERLLQDGILTVHFFNLRSAQTAMAEIQEQHMQHQIRSRQHYNYSLMMMQNWGENSEGLIIPPAAYVPAAQVLPPSGRGLIGGQAVWAQYTVPTTSVMGPAGRNQGTIVVFNLDSGVSASKLQEIFEAFGEVKELRETPSKRNQRFVEFYDIRDAARAMSEMDGKEINGKRVTVEFSRPGGQKWLERKFMNNNNNNPSCMTAPRKSANWNNNNNNESVVVSAAGSSSCPDEDETCTEMLTDSIAALSVVEAVNSKKKKKKKSSSNGDSKKPSVGNNNSGKNSRSRSWNNSKQKGSCSGLMGSQFLIDEGAILESNSIRDTRTTVMIKNIPNKYSQKLLLNMLDNHCIHCNEQISDGNEQPLSSYDFLYLPIDFNNKCNVGYGFVNLTSPQAAWRLYKAFHSQPWEVFNSRKICQVTYARLQGLEALREHFKNSKFACETDEYLPVVFSPPRDGMNPLTEPVAVGGGSSSTNCSFHSTPIASRMMMVRNSSSSTSSSSSNKQLPHIINNTRRDNNNSISRSSKIGENKINIVVGDDIICSEDGVCNSWSSTNYGGDEHDDDGGGSFF